MSSKLQDEQRQEIVYRLLYGEDLIEARGKLYRLVVPNPQLRVLANKVYKQTVRENRFNSWLKDRDCLLILVQNGLCTMDVDANLKEIGKRIDDLKVDLYNSMFRSDLFERNRKTLSAVRAKQEEMFRNRHMLDYLTVKGYAEMVKRQYIILHTLYDFDTSERVWNDWNDLDNDPDLMDLVVTESVQHIVDLSDLRDVARNDPWKSYWNTSKGTPFTIPASHMNDEQRAIILFSQMYDNAAKHPECPPDDVIEDDDLFDGWMIGERRKREKEQMTKQVDNRLGNRHSNADEVYVVAQGSSPEKVKADIDRIHGMNDMRGKIVKHQRQNTLNRLGKATDSQFADRKMEIQQERNQMFVEHVKKGKK